MANIKHIVKASSVAMLLSAGIPSMSGTLPRILVQCNPGQQVSVCDALVQALKARWPDHAISLSGESEAQADLTVLYVEKHRAKDWLSGSLIWQRADGARGEGAVIEFSIMDRMLKSADLIPYAQQLIRSIALPL